MEAIEPAAIRDEIWPLVIGYVPHRLLRPFRMRMPLA